jgi:hypothetical protein
VIAMKLLRLSIILSTFVFFIGCASRRHTDLPQVLYDSWTSTIVSTARYAELVHAGKGDEAERLLEEALVQNAHFLGEVQLPEGREEWRRQMLWVIERYYERTGKPVPADVAKILAGIPARPPASCEIDQQQSLKKP